MHKPSILTVGSINMDLCMYGTEGLPTIGASTFCSGYSYAAGGKGANQAFAVSRLGAHSALAGRVGSQDENGKKLLQSLQIAGVDTRFVVQDTLHPTGMSVMNILPDARYYSIYAKGANDALTPADIEAALDSDAFDMVLMQLEMPLETAYRCFEMAKERRIPVFLDAGPAMHIPLERFHGLFVISPNEAEAEALTGIEVSSEEGIRSAAEKLYTDAQPEYVLIKAGSRGALLYDGNTMTWYPAFSVNAVDTTAAGDTFGAAFAVEYCKGTEIGDAIRRAHAAAAVCVTREGGQPSIPTDEEAYAFYEEHRQEVM